MPVRPRLFAVLLFAVALPARGWSADSRPVSISNDWLRITLAIPSGLLAVEDLNSGVQWAQYLPSRVAQGREWAKVATREISQSELVQVETATVDGNTIQAEAVWRGHPFLVVFALVDADPVLTVTIDTSEREKPLPWKPGWAGTMLMTYPYAFHHETAGNEAVVPIDEGVIYSTSETDPAADPRRWRPWWLFQKLSMPWWGVTDGERGVMTQVDTPYDCMYSIRWVNTPAGERTLPQVTWVGSKLCLAYPRQVTYRFLSTGGYVAMAKAFRRTQQAIGSFRSWEEKVRANPAVGRLRGALDVWSQVTITPQMIDQLRDAGVRKAIVAKVRGGNPTPSQGIEPAAIRAAEEAGFLIGGYHNYSWIQGRWIDGDPSLKNAAVMQADGSVKFIANAWDAKGRLDRCPAAHHSVFVEKGKLDQHLGINYFFTDCTTTGGSLQDCYHPEHPLSRREGVRQLARALQGAGDLGLVIGSERGKWWATSTTHVFEGIETLIEYGGSYYGSGNETHWVGPYLKSKPGYRELCLGYDFNPARRVPLFQLVYHDSVYCARRWNQDPGRDASLWNRHDLMNILYGTPPLWFMHPKAGNAIGTPEWERVKERYLQTYHNVCGWHEKIGFDEMIDHRFLSENRLVQETRFRGGGGVVVNFSAIPWSDPRGFVVPAEDYRILKQEP